MKLERLEQIVRLNGWCSMAVTEDLRTFNCEDCLIKEYLLSEKYCNPRTVLKIAKLLIKKYKLEKILE
jgi:hypothetical protein